MTVSQLSLLVFVFTCMTVFAASDILILLFALAGLGVSFGRKVEASVVGNESFPFCRIGLGFASVFFAKLISSVWAVDSSAAIDNAFNHLHFLLWPALIPFLFRANLRPSQIEITLALTMLFLGAWWGAEFIGVLPSRTGGRFEAGVRSFGMLATVLGFFNLWLLAAVTRCSQSTERRWIMAVGLVCGLLVLYATKARTELLGVLLGMFGILAIRLGEWRSRRVAVTTLLVFVSVGFGAVYGLKDRFFDINREIAAYFSGPSERVAAVQTSVGGRLEMYRVAIEGIKERPLLGWGAGLRPTHLSHHATDATQPLPYRNFHSLYLQSLLEIGLIGSSFAMALGLFLFRHTVWKVWISGRRELGLLCLLLWFSYFWKSLANATFGYGLPNAVFVLFTAWFWVEARRPASEYEV